jgi:hypothetical protein
MLLRMKYFKSVPCTAGKVSEAGGLAKITKNHSKPYETANPKMYSYLDLCPESGFLLADSLISLFAIRHRLRGAHGAPDKISPHRKNGIEH